jgi:hypothetical protein
MAPSHTKAQIEALLQNPIYVDAAIKLLGQNQTADELRFKSTRHHNDIGFSAAYGRVGTRFFEFVTGISTKTGRQQWQPKSLTNPIADRVFSKYVRNRGVAHAVDYARDIATLHWKQLGVMLEPAFQAEVLPTAAPEREVRPAPSMVTVSADIVGARGRAYKVYAFGRRIWLPKSQVTVEGGNITMPLWLARQKGLTGSAIPFAGHHGAPANPENPRGPQ